MSDFEDSSNEAAAADQKPAGYGTRFWRWISAGERKKVQRILGLDPVDAMKSTTSAFEDSSNEEATVDQKPAGYGKRVLGAIIDFLIMGAVLAVPVIVLSIGLAAAEDASDKGEPFTGGIEMLLGGIGCLVVTVWIVWLFGYRHGVTGKTPGKRVAGTRLTRIGTGEAPGGGTGVGRILVPWLINPATGGVYLTIDYLWPLWDDHKQRVSDKMFKTQVVLDDRPATPAQFNPIS
jgi:uncharacterized RDD family membrane protein YckC